MERLTTCLLGASPSPNRYAYRAVTLLVEAGHPVYPLGQREGTIAGVPILTDPDQVPLSEIHTVSMYLAPSNQQMYEQWLLEMSPQRVIFNPGAENASLAKLLHEHQIAVREACTLVMLRTGVYVPNTSQFSVTDL